MILSEFTERTGFSPMPYEYELIEEAYYNFGGDKDAFCKDFVAKGGELKTYQARAAEIWRLRSQIAEMEKEFKADSKKQVERIAALEAKLDAEQEWKPYEMNGNVSQADYEKLADGADSGNCSYYMTDEEAIDWICSEFDFDRSKVTILHEVDEYEVNRHRQLRKTGKKIDRRPVYCATDYHYIRFNTSRWYYECWNDSLCPYYC